MTAGPTRFWLSQSGIYRQCFDCSLLNFEFRIGLVCHRSKDCSMATKGKILLTKFECYHGLSTGKSHKYFDVKVESFRCGEAGLVQELGWDADLDQSRSCSSSVVCPLSPCMTNVPTNACKALSLEAEGVPTAHYESCRTVIMDSTLPDPPFARVFFAIWVVQQDEIPIASTSTLFLILCPSLLCSHVSVMQDDTYIFGHQSTANYSL